MEVEEDQNARVDCCFRDRPREKAKDATELLNLFLVHGASRAEASFRVTELFSPLIASWLQEVLRRHLAYRDRRFRVSRSLLSAAGRTPGVIFRGSRRKFSVATLCNSRSFVCSCIPMSAIRSLLNAPMKSLLLW